MGIVLVDSKLKRKIESISGKEDVYYMVKFKDLDDTFWFSDYVEFQEFLNQQSRERYYDKEVRKGYFDYINDANETLRYYVKSNRGALELIREENLGIIALG